MCKKREGKGVRVNVEHAYLSVSAVCPDAICCECDANCADCGIRDPVVGAIQQYENVFIDPGQS